MFPKGGCHSIILLIYAEHPGILLRFPGGFAISREFNLLISIEAGNGTCGVYSFSEIRI